MIARTALARSAILGTRHGAPAIATPDPEAAALIAPAAGDSPEHALLQAAAVLGVIKRAQSTPRRFEKREDPAPEETLPRCGPLAAADLREILNAHRREFLTEWLDLAARFGRRCPEELLPQLLSRSFAEFSLREPVARVAGERGRWLARYETRWRGTFEASDAVLTFRDSSDIDVRVRELKRLRAEDPALAREQLEAAWPKEAAVDRYRLLATLRVNLSMDDEPFLERLRDAKGKNDRTTVNALLHRLPGSLAAERATTLASRYLTLKRGLLGRELVVTLPEFSPELAAEGIVDVHHAGAGNRSTMLTQLLTFVPVDFWLDTFRVSLEKLIHIARKSDFAVALLSGFAGSIAAYRNVAARDALYALAANDDAYFDLALEAKFTDESPIPEAPFLEAFRANHPRAAEFVELASHPWSVRLSTSALHFARDGFARSGDFDAWRNRSKFLRNLVANVSIETPDALQGWPQTYADEGARKLADDLFDELSFRFAMYEHLKDGT